MRLLMFVPDGYPTFRGDVSTLFGKYLPRHRILSDLIAQASARDATEATHWGAGEVFLCAAPTGRVRKHLALLTLVVGHLLRCRKERYDAIQVRDAVLPALIGLCIARREGIPFFYWMSYPIYEAHIERLRAHPLSMGLLRYVGVALRGHVGNWLLYRCVLPASDHIFVQSHRMLEDVAREGVAESKMTPVLMGADLDAIDASLIEPAHDARLEGRRVVAYLGTLARVRRIDFLFEVLARVKQHVSNAVLVLAGDANEPSDREWLQQRAREVGVADDVIWTGWLPKEEAWRFVRASEVAVSPIPPSSELDCGSPTKAVEYLALGVSTVGNDQPDQARVIRESGAGICVPYSVEAFASAIVGLLEHPGEAVRMGARGPSYVAAHRSYEVIARGLAATYGRLIHRQVGMGTEAAGPSPT